MSILNVNTIQPIGSGTTVTVAATELKTSNFITVGTGASVTSPSANVLTLGTNTAERFRITSAGSIGIGTDNPGTKLDVRGGNWSNGDIVVGQSGNAGRIKFRRGADGSDSAFIGFAAADNNSRLSIGVDSGDGTIAFQTNSAERLRVDSSGRLLVGHTSSVSSLADVKIEAVSGAGAEIHLARNDSSVTDGNAIGILRFYGNDGGTYQECARINCQADGTHADGDKPSRLTFYTTPSGAQTSAERLRITSDGKVGIGEDSPDRLLHIKGASSTAYSGGSDTADYNFLKIENTTDDKSAGIFFLIGSNGEAAITATEVSDGATDIAFQNRGGGVRSEKLRIDSGGRVTKPLQPLAVIGTTQNNPTPSAGSIAQFDYVATNRGNHYNTTNYTFTCPVAGDYMVIFRHSRKGWCGDLDLQKNGTTHAFLELRETGLNGAGTPVPDWQAGSYSFIVPCAANDVLRWRVANVYTSTGSGGYMLDGYNHIKYDAVTYYLIG